MSPPPNPPAAKNPPQTKEDAPGIRPLVLQADPNPAEENFANSMTIAIAAAGRMLFEYVADHDGSLTLDAERNLRVLGERCAAGASHSHAFALTWSVVNADGSLTALAGYSAAVNRYDFRSGNKYRLTYEIPRMSVDFADCRAVTIRFAVSESSGERR